MSDEMPEPEAQDWRTKQARFEFKRDPSNDMLIGPDGCHYENEAKAMYFSLGLCGCGCPEKVHALLIDCLKQFQGNGELRGGISGIECIIKERPEIVAEFVAHFLSAKSLTEHGSSVYGSWLTDRGNQFAEIGPMVDDE